MQATEHLNRKIALGRAPALPPAADGGYRALCGKLLGLLLARDGWTLEALPASPKRTGAGRDRTETDAALLARQGRRRIAFFFNNQDRRTLTRAFGRIKQADRGRFQLLGVLVTPTTAVMQQCRHADQARKFPRAFFASFEEICEAAALVAPVEYAAAGGPVPRQSFTATTPVLPGGIASFAANILANTPVGGPHSAHYRLAFKAPLLQEVQPPQFVMMDTTPARVPLGARTVERGRGPAAVDVGPRPLLKRPFGICRDFHPDFPSDYVKRLALPPSLALALHIAQPDHFDMLYKVIPNGLGTALMTQLKRGQKVHMLGPLGRPFDVRRLRAAGVQAVHVIGGGVGMAPLILLVEALRYHAFPVKVFLGIARLESLRYRDELAATFGEKPRAAYVYIDDLLAAGVAPADVYVSVDSEPPAKAVRGIPRENLFHGLVPEQYRRYLEKTKNTSLGTPPHPAPERHGAGLSPATGERPVPLRAGTGEGGGPISSIMAFTCGPNRMMELVGEIAREHGIPLQVLLEKRMGCGLGVCFSCVQKVRRADGTADYVRICTEGPLFEAKDILWKNDDSQSLSASSSCAARC